jgi:hypothetical protein
MYLRRIIDGSSFLIACWLAWWLKYDKGDSWYFAVVVAAATFIVLPFVLSRALGLLLLCRLKLLYKIMGIKEPPRRSGS